MHLGNKNFCIKFEYVFSAPECLLVCKEWKIWKVISKILKSKQVTSISVVRYSRISVFSLIVVLLNFLKYLRRVLFPSMAVSALSGLVLCLCQDFSCPMTGSRF